MSTRSSLSSPIYGGEFNPLSSSSISSSSSCDYYLLLHNPNHPSLLYSLSTHGAVRISALKHHLSQAYPTYPSVELQRIICSGKLLADDQTIQEIYESIAKVAHSLVQEVDEEGEHDNENELEEVKSNSHTSSSTPSPSHLNEEQRQAQLHRAASKGKKRLTFHLAVKGESTPTSPVISRQPSEQEVHIHHHRSNQHHHHQHQPPSSTHPTYTPTPTETPHHTTPIFSNHPSTLFDLSKVSTHHGSHAPPTTPALSNTSSSYVHQPVSSTTTSSPPLANNVKKEETNSTLTPAASHPTDVSSFLSQYQALALQQYMAQQQAMAQYTAQYTAWQQQYYQYYLQHYYQSVVLQQQNSHQSAHTTPPSSQTTLPTHSIYPPSAVHPTCDPATVLAAILAQYRHPASTTESVSIHSTSSAQTTPASSSSHTSTTISTSSTETHVAGGVGGAGDIGGGGGGGMGVNMNDGPAAAGIPGLEGVAPAAAMADAAVAPEQQQQQQRGGLLALIIRLIDLRLLLKFALLYVLFSGHGSSGAGGSEYAQQRNIGLIVVMVFAYLWQVLRRQPEGANGGLARGQAPRGRNGPNQPDDEDDAFEREQLRELELQHQLERAAQRRAGPLIVEGPGGERVEIRPAPQTWTEKVESFIVGFLASLNPSWRPIPVPMAMPDPVTDGAAQEQEQQLQQQQQQQQPLGEGENPEVDQQQQIRNDDEIAAAVEAVEAALAAAE